MLHCCRHANHDIPERSLGVGAVTSKSPVFSPAEFTSVLCTWGLRRLSIRRSRISLFLLILLLVSGLAQATTVQRLSLEEMTQKAGSIALVRVKGSRTYWQGKLILTTYTVDVQETLKGVPSRSLEITAVGGVIGPTTLHVAGMPVFRTGEDAVVFVERSGAFSTVVGLSQGKFTVQEGQVANTVTGLSFSDGKEGRPLTMPLTSFKQQLKQIVERQSRP